MRAPHSGEPRRKRRWPSSRREVDGATTGEAQGQATTTPLGEAATADAETDGGARDAAQAAETAKVSEPSARQGSSAPPGVQIGAGGRHTVPAGHGFGVTWVSYVRCFGGREPRNSSIVGRSGGREPPELHRERVDRVTRSTHASSVGGGGSGRPVVARTDSRWSVTEPQKGGGDGMTTQQVLSEGGDGPR